MSFAIMHNPFFSDRQKFTTSDVARSTKKCISMSFYHSYLLGNDCRVETLSFIHKKTQNGQKPHFCSLTHSQKIV